MYAAYHSVDEATADDKLRELIGSDETEPPVIDDTPRIVLVAGDFRAEVTTTVLWLVDNFENMDIRCVRLQPFQVGDRTLVASEVIIPLPEAEQYRLSVQRKRRDVIETQAAKAKARTRIAVTTRCTSSMAIRAARRRGLKRGHQRHDLLDHRRRANPA
jgi:hypothetical protein